MFRAFESSFLRGDSGMVGPSVDGIVHRVVGATQWGMGGGGIGTEQGEARSEDAVVGSRVEHRCAPACFGELIAVSTWPALDQAVQAQAAQVVGQLSRAQWAGVGS